MSKYKRMQHIFSLLIFIFGILSICSVFGYRYYRSKVNEEIEKNARNERAGIQEKISVESSKIVENQDSIFSGLEKGQNEIIKAIEFGGNNFKTLSYPIKGEFGPNILNPKITNCSSGDFSMKAEIPKGEKIRVILSGKNWGYPVFQPIQGWKYSDPVNKDGIITRSFESIKDGVVDFKIILTAPDKIQVSVYENDLDQLRWENNFIVM